MQSSAVSTSANHKNLKDVIAIIPASCYENAAWKGLLYAARDTAIYAVTIAALLSTDNLLFLLPLWLFSGLVVSALFVVGHDAGHHALFKSKRLCDWVGRITMLPSLHIFAAWQFGHNRVHHGFTVHEGRDFVWHPYSVADYEKLNRFGKLMHRLEWSWAGGGIYYLLEVWWKKMFAFKAPAKYAKDFRFDRFFVYGFLAASAAALGAYAVYGLDLSGGEAARYTAWLFFKTVFMPFFLFNYFIGIVVYLHHIGPELKWHDHAHWSKFRGQMEGTMIYRVQPAVLDFFLHKIMIHVPHHVDMRIPFYHLEEAAEHIKAHFPEVVQDRPLRIRDYFHFTRRCKLYDFDEETWMDYERRVQAHS